VLILEKIRVQQAFSRKTKQRVCTEDGKAIQRAIIRQNGHVYLILYCGRIFTFF
jgi:hypothetical protein